MYSDSDDFDSATGKATVRVRKEVYSGIDSLSAERCLEIFRLMVRTRALEERTIKMSKSGEGFFWVGGPGEEAFNVCLGLQADKGQGAAHDYLHLHYRNGGVLLALGMSMLDHVRQMAMKATDPHSMGRNFVGHYAVPKWNVLPVTSVIEVQYTMAPGTAIMQKRHGGIGVSVVVGGDAGTAEGDFTSCMVWSTRPGHELPVLMVVTNNNYGISTPAPTQHSERRISDRGEAFGIPGEHVDGNDPIAIWHALERAFEYCRRHRKPYLLEAMVSRLHGHSSSSGAARVTCEIDCLRTFEDRLISAGVIHRELAELIHHDAHEEADRAVEQAMTEPTPTIADVQRFTFAPSEVDAVYPNDYTGLPS
jgi:2-oxoisovalerate dehydrogenase E1 component alpha subunit